ncbi:MAG: LytTR family DNA-binding domain-containing protein [Sphingomicrobium sp.]
MASAVPRSALEDLRTRRLRGLALVAFVAAVWLAGALYCSGYEQLARGIDNWPGSLWWSAAAVLPWLALFEWSKSERGKAATRAPLHLAAAIVVTAALSLGVEAGVDALLGHATAPIALSLMRRLPAVAAAVVLILWSRAGQPAQIAAGDENLTAMAGSIDWIGAADNYVELHIGGRMVMRRTTMRAAERALAPLGFVRIHRRFLVNGARIADIAGPPGDLRVRLASGAELPAGRAYAANLSAIA